MWNVGGPEILVILVVALIVLGPKRLPEAGRQVGRALREFRNVTAGVQQELRDALPLDELRKSMPMEELREFANMRDSIARDLKNAMNDTAAAAAAPSVTPSLRAAADGTVQVAGLSLAADDVERIHGVEVVRGVDVPAPDGHAAEMDAPACVTRVVAVPAPSTESSW